MQTLRHNHIIAILFSCYSSLVLHVVTLIVTHALPCRAHMDSDTELSLGFSLSVGDPTLRS